MAPLSLDDEQVVGIGGVGIAVGDGEAVRDPPLPVHLELHLVRPRGQDELGREVVPPPELVVRAQGLPPRPPVERAHDHHVLRHAVPRHRHHAGADRVDALHALLEALLHTPDPLQQAFELGAGRRLVGPELDVVLHREDVAAEGAHGRLDHHELVVHPVDLLHLLLDSLLEEAVVAVGRGELFAVLGAEGGQLLVHSRRAGPFLADPVALPALVVHSLDPRLALAGRLDLPVDEELDHIFIVRLLALIRL
mmetsp:Transcript_23379/g.73179  ORF Transcript_23379/g.73179 Transcript_23379/m.73179 type:complete len:251 (+) Transcript_23379:101-853(+)